jgi:3-hydroxy-9,10-secoandrosta-1,3,5(10)-triene-9,17-dione monooxygenase
VTTSTDTITHDKALERARALVPVLAERAEKTESLRHIPDETLTDFVDSGLMRISQPKMWGGSELPLTTQIEVVEELGRGCGATAWTIGVYISHNWNLSLFTPQAQHDVWGTNPDAIACTSAVGGPRPQRVEGGVHIEEGKWTFLSGVYHADWIVVNTLLAPVGDPTGQPEMTSLLVPKGDYEILDDWHTTALRGSGTCSVLLRDVFVPEHRLLSFTAQQNGTTPGGAHHDNPMYRAPLDATWPAYLAAPALGIARGALEAWTERTQKRRNAYTGGPMIEQPINHFRLGEACARIDAARTLVYRAMDSVTAHDAGDTDLDLVRVRNRRDFSFAVRQAVEAVETVFLSSGASALSTSSPIQRHWRDVHGVAQHAMFDYERSLSAWGRRTLGVTDGLDF